MAHMTVGGAAEPAVCVRARAVAPQRPHVWVGGGGGVVLVAAVVVWGGVGAGGV